jgi:hypothetical protein
MNMDYVNARTTPWPLLMDSVNVALASIWISLLNHVAIVILAVITDAPVAQQMTVSVIAQTLIWQPVQMEYAYVTMAFSQKLHPI